MPVRRLPAPLALAALLLGGMGCRGARPAQPVTVEVREPPTASAEPERVAGARRPTPVRPPQPAPEACEEHSPEWQRDWHCAPDHTCTVLRSHTPRGHDCTKLMWVDLADNIRTNLEGPCDLLDVALILERLVEFNDQAHLRSQEVLEGWGTLRSAMLTLVLAARALAAAKQEGDLPRALVARERVLDAITTERRTIGWFSRTVCRP